MIELQGLEDILILLGLALVNALLFSRLRLSPIIGYLVTGVLVGPYGYHLIRGVHQVEMMAELGVILLLFTIGLEFSFTRILRLKGLMLKSGTTQLVLTGLLVFLGCLLLGLPRNTAIALGMAMALSSTAIVLKLLTERGEIDSAHGRISLAILLFQDLSVIFFLVTLPLLGGNSHALSPFAILYAAALLGGLFVFSRYLLQPLLRSVLRTRTPELFRITILALVLFTAWVTAQAGLSLALGAFLAGLSLAESDYSHQVVADILPFRDTFLAIFFISIGMLVDVRFLLESWHVLLVLFLLLCLVKALAATAAALWARYPLGTALIAGLTLFQVGEFSFVLLKQAMDLQLMTESVYQMSLSLVALSMMATPLIVPRAEALAAGVSRLLGRGAMPLPTEDRERTGNLEGHVIVAGYGVSGRNVARVLREMHLPYVLVELNAQTVAQARRVGEFILYGDVTAPPLLEGIGIHRARALVLAINDPAALARAISAARTLNPDLYILARTRFVLELDHLRGLGADEVIPDEFEASLQLAANLLRHFGVSEGHTLKQLASLRQEHYGRMRSEDEPPPNLSGYLSVLEEGQIEFQAVPDDSPCLGSSLAELSFRARTGAMVVGVVRKERIVYGANAEFRLEPGDTLMLLGGEKDVERARALVHGRMVAGG